MEPFRIQSKLIGAKGTNHKRLIMTGDWYEVQLHKMVQGLEEASIALQC